MGGVGSSGASPERWGRTVRPARRGGVRPEPDRRSTRLPTDARLAAPHESPSGGTPRPWRTFARRRSPTTPSSAATSSCSSAPETGDLDAFNDLVVLYQDQLFALVVRMVPDRDQASDAVQEAFFSAFRNLATFRGGSVKSWLNRICVNAAMDTQRLRKRRPVQPYPELEDESWQPPAGAEADPERTAVHAERSRALGEALAHITDDQRTAIVLYDIEGYDYARDRRHDRRVARGPSSRASTAAGWPCAGCSRTAWTCSVVDRRHPGHARRHDRLLVAAPADRGGSLSPQLAACVECARLLADPRALATLPPIATPPPDPRLHAPPGRCRSLPTPRPAPLPRPRRPAGRRAGRWPSA